MNKWYGWLRQIPWPRLFPGLVFWTGILAFGVLIPWLGLYATEIGNRIVIASLASRGPAEDADLNTGDIVLAVDGNETRDLADFFRMIWSLGDAGIEVPLLIHREGDTFEVRVRSGDRGDYLKAPVLH